MNKKILIVLLLLLSSISAHAQSDSAMQIEEVVITGSMKLMTRSQSVIPVEIISSKLFQKNPTPSLFEAVGMLNGVQPQINCNVCNTGDIHINGMEGPYTMVLIDGMPIVSSLSTIYGLSGIPNSMIDRVEIVKGPAAALYGSEAMGGIINVITKNPNRAAKLSVDAMATSWQEYLFDVASKINFTKKIKGLIGLNYFNYNAPIDNNKDGFTDVAIQKRISIFNKWNIERKANRLANLALRYVGENRWGGEMNWTEKWRGTDSIYGEQITTKRWELIAQYQLPFKEKFITQFSYNWHDQNSMYGQIPYIANQQVAFAQTYWDKELKKNHSLLLGASVRYMTYDDNTAVTASANGKTNMPQHTFLPGIFAQDEWRINKHSKLLTGYRFDYNEHHGSVHSPRVAYKFAPNYTHTFRASVGTGFRIVNLYTEDHAALTGARAVIISEALKPEKSYNATVNYILKLPSKSGIFNIDITSFYSYFTNKIVGDFDSDPQKIIYKNLSGNAVSRGISVNVEREFIFPIKLNLGISLMDVFSNTENNLGQMEYKRQIHAPLISGNGIISYQANRKLALDFTLKFYGPMRLPIVPNDFRPQYSPWFGIANIQATYALRKTFSLYGGVKNILNFVPKNPILRPFDPFNKQINDPINNPNGYTFDPSYNYASMQGARLFFGLRYTL